MMGLNNVTCKGVKGKLFQCALVEPTGVIKSLDIPFHLALRYLMGISNKLNVKFYVGIMNNHVK